MGTAVDTIIIEDDDDDVRVFAPHSSIQRSGLQASINTSFHPVHVPVLDDYDLELRLGPSGNVPAAPRLGTLGRRSRPEPAVYVPLPSFQDSLLFSPTIDLTSALDNYEGYHSIPAKKKHCLFPPESRCLPPPEVSREVKLTCAICMDTMEEETSTICGMLTSRIWTKSFALWIHLNGLEGDMICDSWKRLACKCELQCN
ncbi:hypothetical protein GOP47_0005040 [Adiantum capillus-veneris]|uniref:Uncharacterized protein n=1 Tax=Adiantum capillus-veneris TaxID=13818 RepID=A0A9D4V4E3_ADICA|nr:hypothetical protein GOP47_0005040 [Adiantum capillus-veneris]